MGNGAATNLTAIGDAVNTASRLETLSKEVRAQLVLSQDAANRSDLDLDTFPAHESKMKGRADTLRLRAVISALDLPL